MSNVNVPLLYWFNGQLTINRDNKATYLDEIVKPMIMRKSITIRELVEKLHQITKINPNDHQSH